MSLISLFAFLYKKLLNLCQFNKSIENKGEAVENKDACLRDLGPNVVLLFNNDACQKKLGESLGLYKYDVCSIDSDGKNDKLIHIEDEGNHFWYKNGKQHRDDDQPAAIYTNRFFLAETCNWIELRSYMEWYQEGKLHRYPEDCSDEEKPAVIRVNGDKLWYKEGRLYRDNDKPARVWCNYGYEFIKNGKQHRLLGYALKESPATDCYSWYINGESLEDGNSTRILRKLCL